MGGTPNESAQLEWQSSLSLAQLRVLQEHTRLLREISKKGGGNENVTELAKGLLDTVVPGAGALAGAFVSNGPTPIILIVIAVELGLILYRLGIPEQIVEIITKNPFNPTSWALNYVNDHMKDKECSLTIAELINDYVNGPSIGGKLDHLNWAISGPPQDLPRDAIFSNALSPAMDLAEGFLKTVGLEAQAAQAKQIKEIVNKIISAPDYRSGSLLTQLAGSVKELGAWEKIRTVTGKDKDGKDIIELESDELYNARIQGRYETFNSLMRQLLVAMGTRDKDLPGKPTVPTIEKSYLDDIFAQLSAEQTAIGSPITLNSTLRDIIKALQINFPPELIENNRLKTATNLDLAPTNTALGHIQTKVEATNTALGNLSTITGATNTALGRLETKAEATNTALGNLSTITGATNTALGTLNTKATQIDGALNTIESDLTYNGLPIAWILNDIESFLQSPNDFPDHSVATISEALNGIWADIHFEGQPGLKSLANRIEELKAALGTIDGRLHSAGSFGDKTLSQALNDIHGDIQIDGESVFKTIRNLLRNESNSPYLREILNKLAGFATEATLASIKGSTTGIAETIGHGELGDVTVYEQLKQILANAFGSKTDLDQIAATLGNADQDSISVNAFKIMQSTFSAQSSLQKINTKLGGDDPTLFNVIYEMSQKESSDGCCDEEWDTDGNIVRPEPRDALPVNTTADIECQRVEMLLDIFKSWMDQFCSINNLTGEMLGTLGNPAISGGLRGAVTATIRRWAPTAAGLSLEKETAMVAIRVGLGSQLFVVLGYLIPTAVALTWVAGSVVECALKRDFPAMLGLTGSGPYGSLKCTLYQALKDGKTGAEFKALWDAWIDSVVFQGDLTLGVAPATRKAILRTFMPLGAAEDFVSGKLINFTRDQLLDPNGNPYPGDCTGCGGATTPAQGVGHVVSLTSFGGFFGNTSWYFWEVPAGIQGRTNKRGSVSANDVNGQPGYVVIAPFPTGERRMRIVSSDRANSTLPLPNKNIVVEWNNGGGSYIILPGANQGNWITIGPTTSNTPGIIKAAGATNFNIQAGSGATGLDPTLPPYDFGVEFDPPLPTS